MSPILSLTVIHSKVFLGNENIFEKNDSGCTKTLTSDESMIDNDKTIGMQYQI